MKSLLTLGSILLLACQASKADDARVAAAVAHANLRHQQRQRVEPGIPAAAELVPTSAKPVKEKAEKPLTYAEAHRLSLSSGKPLLVWVGGKIICPD